MREELLKLKMNGALDALEDLSKRRMDNLSFGKSLLEAEILFRDERTGRRKISVAKFSYEREWQQINGKKNPKIPFGEIQKLSSGNFLNTRKNICLIGKTGLGKTHSLISIGRDLCRKNKDVLFFTAASLVTKLEESKSENKLSRLMEKLKKVDLLIIDELGFVPFSDTGARLLFDVFTTRYQVAPIAISTNLSFEKWTQVFGSVELTAALIDRFTHNCEIYMFEGDSMRLREAKERTTGKKSIELERGKC
jgi:DNA replication protein DnaC